MLDVTRKAIRKITNWYPKRYDYPHLNSWVGLIPERFRRFVGFDEAYVIMCGDLLTISLTSHVGGDMPVPCMPWNQPGGVNSVPRDISRVLAAVAGQDGGGRDCIVEVGYMQAAGRELVHAGKVVYRGELETPVLEVNCTARAVPGGRAMKHETTIAKLDGLFVVGAMADHTKEQAIYLQTELTGYLMTGHEGKLEFRGSDVPIVLRANEGGLVSIIQPSPPPKLRNALTEMEIIQQQHLPGLWNETLEKAAEDLKAVAEGADPDPKPKKEKKSK